MPPKITQQQQQLLLLQQEPLSPTLSANHRNATNALLASLAGLESMLAPLFASTSALSETVAKLDTEKRCQLELLLAYALNTFVFSTSPCCRKGGYLLNLLFVILQTNIDRFHIWFTLLIPPTSLTFTYSVNLKTNGTAPASHPVMLELVIALKRR